MTIFSFNTFNHCPQGKIIVEDITRIMGYQLMALGYAVAWSDTQFERGRHALNVVLESFADDPATIETIAREHAAGARFLCVATEEPTERGFNHGLDPAMIDRQRVFPIAAPFFDGILHLIPGEHITSWCRRFAPSAHAELGFAPALLASGNVEPDHDFGFYGKMTWRREQMLDCIEQASGGKVLRITSLDVPRRERDATMRRARVILQIRANDEWGMVSSSRCATALCFGRPVIAEPHPLAHPWDQVVRFSGSVETFYEDAIALAREDWRGEHARQLARFAERFTPQRCIGAPLRKIGVVA